MYRVFSFNFISVASWQNHLSQFFDIVQGKEKFVVSFIDVLERFGIVVGRSTFVQSHVFLFQDFLDTKFWNHRNNKRLNSSRLFKMFEKNSKYEKLLKKIWMELLCIISGIIRASHLCQDAPVLNSKIFQLTRKIIKMYEAYKV